MAITMEVGESRLIVIDGLVGSSTVAVPQTRVINVFSSNTLAVTVEYGFLQYPPDDATEVGFLLRAAGIGTATITATYRPGATTFTATLAVTVTAVGSTAPPSVPAPAAPAGLTGIQIDPA